MTEPQTFVRPLPKGEARRLKISVVVPMLNEERGLGPLIDRLRPVLDGLGHDWEVICVDDGSTDNTLAVLKGLNDQDQRIKSISLRRNFGKEIATAAGLSFTTGDAAIIMDADLQHPPELIADFVGRWREGYDVVFGQRIDRHADTLMHRFSARAFYISFQKLSGTSLPEGAGDFRLLDRKAVDAMNGMSERVRFNKGLFAWMGFRSIVVPFNVPPRH